MQWLGYKWNVCPINTRFLDRLQNRTQRPPEGQPFRRSRPLQLEQKIADFIQAYNPAPQTALFFRTTVSDVEKAIRAVADEEARNPGFKFRVALFVPPRLFLALLETELSVVRGVVHVRAGEASYLEFYFEPGDTRVSFFQELGGCVGPWCGVGFAAAGPPVCFWAVFKGAGFLGLDGVRRLLQTRLSGAGAEVEVDMRAGGVRVTVPCGWGALALGLLRGARVDGVCGEVRRAGPSARNAAVRRLRVYEVPVSEAPRGRPGPSFPGRPVSVLYNPEGKCLQVGFFAAETFHPPSLREAFADRAAELSGERLQKAVERLIGEKNAETELQPGRKYLLLPACFLVSADADAAATRRLKALLQLLHAWNLPAEAVFSGREGLSWEVESMGAFLSVPVSKKTPPPPWEGIPAIALGPAGAAAPRLAALVQSNAFLVVERLVEDTEPQEKTTAHKDAALHGIAGPLRHRLWTGRDKTAEVQLAGGAREQPRLGRRQIVVGSAHLKRPHKEELKTALQSLPGVEHIAWSAEGDFVLQVGSDDAEKNVRRRIAKIQVDGEWLQSW